MLKGSPIYFTVSVEIYQMSCLYKMVNNLLMTDAVQDGQISFHWDCPPQRFDKNIRWVQDKWNILSESEVSCEKAKFYTE